MVSCRIISQQGPEVHLSAQIATAEGTVCTQATGTYYVFPRDKFEKLIYGQE
jgi:hypothetical protein